MFCIIRFSLLAIAIILVIFLISLAICIVWRGAKQMAAFWCFCKESTSLHVTRGTDIYSRFLLVLYKNITSFLNIIIFFLYFTSIILTIHTWYSITCSCFTRVLVIALAFTCCFALFILLNIRSCRVSFL